MFKHILVATDGTKLSDKAIKLAAAMAKSSGGRLTGFYAAGEYKTPYVAEGAFYDWPTPANYKKEVGLTCEKLLSRVTKIASDAGVTANVAYAFNDRPHEAIISEARKVKADLIVLASQGRRAVSALLLGSETQKVLAMSKIPVLIVR